MEDVKAETWLDRTGWGDGPWSEEPDRVEWRDGPTGLPCLARRHDRFGHWCGYVGVGPDHPLFESGEDEVLPAHGGVTYTGHCEDDERPLRERVCHLAEPGEPDQLWWFGFDCAHAGDLSPGMHAMEREASMRLGIRIPSLGSTYRDIGYVKVVCGMMAHALDGMSR